VVGCYLVRSGLHGAAALREIARLRRGLPDGEFESPETAAQRQFVLDWRGYVVRQQNGTSNAPPMAEPKGSAQAMLAHSTRSRSLRLTHQGQINRPAIDGTDAPGCLNIQRPTIEGADVVESLVIHIQCPLTFQRLAIEPGERVQRNK